MTAASSRRCWSRRWISRTGRASRRARPRAAGAAACAARGIGSYLEVTAPPGEGDGRHPLRGRRHGDDHHRHARLRPGPCVALRAGARRPARHSLRAHPAAARRQRPARRGRRHRRLALGDVERSGPRRGRQRGDRSAARRSPGFVLEAASADIEFAGGRFAIAGTDRGIGLLELAQKLRKGLKLPPDAAAIARRRRLPPTRRPRPFPMAATSPRSRSIPRPASSPSCATPW